MKLTIKIHDLSTGEIVEREMNAQELEQYEKDQQEAIDKAAAVKAKATGKAALLDRLGITADEAKLLLTK
jgi:hypothetical protein